MNNGLVKAAVYGTLVSDASGMGLHWIYSQGKIASVVKKHGGEPEFFEPDEENYQGVPSFFAHPTRSAGDGSNYSEYLYILFKSIKDGEFSVGRYIRNFAEYFGVGGAYVGYADGPMRETVFNITNMAKNIDKKVKGLTSSLDEKKLAAVAHYISRYFFEYEPDELKSVVKGPLKLQEFSKDELAEVDSLVDQVADLAGSIGPDDDQMPALSRSALLPMLYSGSELDSVVEKAVRITNNNDDAVAYSVFMARILAELYEQGSPAAEDVSSVVHTLVKKHSDVLSDKGRELITKALEYPELDYRAATKSFGAACHVHMAVPLSVHILANTSSFIEANRVNILASGDNCGRSIFLGAMAGALYGIGGDAGIPQEWIDRTRMISRINDFSVL